MKAPDKIYVTIDRPDERIEYNPELVGVAWSKKDKSCEHIEYIRKGALLDYFHQRVEELNSPLNGVFGSTEREHCNERISELLLLIDKLNSM